MKACSICKSTEHNKRTCPQRIKDTSFRVNNGANGANGEYTEESIMIDPKREVLIKHLLDREAYEIESDTFEVWLHNNRPCHLGEVKHVMDRGLSRESIMMYLRIAGDIDTYY